MFADVAEDECTCFGAKVVEDVLVDDVVGEMAAARHDTLFQAPRIGAHLQHFQVMIGFEQEDAAILQVDADGIGHVTQISADADLAALGAEGESDRI